jgi:hypothetical protein
MSRVIVNPLPSPLVLLPDEGVSVVRAAPLELADSSRTLFTAPEAFRFGSLQVFLNGIFETDILETSDTQFSFDTAPTTGDRIALNYLKG